MAFLKDDRDAAKHIKGLVNHFASGNSKDNLNYRSEFSSLEDIRNLAVETLEEIYIETSSGGGYSRNNITDENLSQATLFVDILDSVVEAKVKNQDKIV